MLSSDYHSDSILEIVQRENITLARELLDHRELLSDTDLAFIRDLIERPALHEPFAAYWQLQAIMRHERVDERETTLTAAVNRASHYS
jgi:hypothetical protein